MVATARALATIEKAGGLATQWEPDEIDVIKNVLCKGITDNELKLFAYQCQRTGLDPFTRQIHAIKRGSGDRAQLTIQIGIDGLRLIAERTGRYCPGRAPTFAYDHEGRLVSATAYVLKLVNGNWLEVSATAFFAEYVQMYDGKPSGLWAKMPHGQTAKCAESLALRKAFPNETSGAYSDHEVGQVDEPSAGNAVTEPNIIRQEPESDRCDATAYRAKYFAIADGTSYSDKLGRANFLFEFSGGKTNSLSDYLETASPEMAARLIGALKAKVKDERSTPDVVTGEVEMTEDERHAAAVRAELFTDDEPAAAPEPATPLDPSFDPSVLKPWFTNAVEAKGDAPLIPEGPARALGDAFSATAGGPNQGITLARYLTGRPSISWRSVTEEEARLLRRLLAHEKAAERLAAVLPLAVDWLTTQSPARKKAS